MTGGMHIRAPIRSVFRPWEEGSEKKDFLLMKILPTSGGGGVYRQPCRMDRNSLGKAKQTTANKNRLELSTLFMAKVSLKNTTLQLSPKAPNGI
jgi:hypothetical protein